MISPAGRRGDERGSAAFCKCADLASEQGCSQLDPPGVGVVRLVRSTLPKEIDHTADTAKPAHLQLNLGIKRHFARVGLGYR